ILAVVAAGCLLRGEAVPLPGAAPSRTTAPLKRRAVLAGVGLALVLAVAALTILPFYFFQGFGAWWQGFTYQMGHRASGHAAFFFGEYSNDGWWSYFVVALLLKTPLGSLALIAASLVFWGWG